MIWTDIAVKAGIHQGFNDFINIQATAGGEMSALLKGTILHNFYIADVHKADASHSAVFAHHLYNIVGGGASQRTGAQAQAVCRAVYQFQKAIEVFLTGDDAGEDRK